MKKLMILAFFLVLVCSSIVSDAAGVAIYVDDSNTSGIEDGTVTHPYNTIAEGINAATAGDSVYVSAGEYAEHVVMKPSVNLIGAGADDTVINGGGTGTVVTGAESGLISGFTIMNSGPSSDDCGISCQSLSMTIDSNKIINCTDGINSYASSIYIINNVLMFNGNTGNATSDFTIMCNNSSLTIANNVIAHNWEEGIYTAGSGSNAARIVSNTIAYNAWSGIWCYMSSPMIKNNIIVGNTSGIDATHSSSPAISYNDVWGNSWLNYVAQSGGVCEPGLGDISADPLFTDEGAYDYHLTDLSPCLAAGVMDMDIPATDLEENFRPMPTWSRPDIGAYENAAGAVKDDYFGTWDGQGVFYRHAETTLWQKMATPADLITCGDLDGDGRDDLIGLWPGQGGTWVKYSQTGTWSKIASTPLHMAAGDMNGDGREDLLGSWSGQGVFYRDSISGAWVKMASAASLVTAGDLDGDQTDDLIGLWPAQGGVWAKYSKTGTWGKLSSPARDIATGDMNSDSRVDFLGTWDGLGVYYRDSLTGGWVKMSNPSDLVTAGDVEGDGGDDLLGSWPAQGGGYVKYSSTGIWGFLSSPARDIGAGRMRALGGGGSGILEPMKAFGESTEGPAILRGYRDLSSRGPGGSNFIYRAEMNLIPRGQRFQAQRNPGPGEPGFQCVEEDNPVPHKESPKKDKGKDSSSSAVHHRNKLKMF